MSYRLFLFDLDGTLIDTSPGIINALRTNEEELGIPPLPEETLKKFIGPPLEWSFEEYYRVSPETAHIYTLNYRKIYGTEGARLSRLYPCIQETLRFIREQGGRCAVCTLKAAEMVGEALSPYQLEPLFDVVVGRSEQNPTKADTIHAAMRELHWKDFSSAVLLGDSRYDGEGAKEAGVDFLALTYGFGFLEPGSLEGLPRVGVAREPSDVLRFVKEQFSD